MKRQLILFLILTINASSFAQNLTVILQGKQDVMCFGLSNGIAQVIASGGTGNYSYIWNTIPPQMTNVATHLSAGIYTVTVNDGVDTATLNVEIFEPAMLECPIIVIQNDTNGQGSGILSVYAQGGTIPYSYYWSNGSTSSITYNLTAGTYTTTVFDHYGCGVMNSHQIINATCSSQFLITPDTIPHNYNVINYASGKPPLTYNWSWGDGTFDNSAYPTHTYSIVGNYTICLTVSDAAGCTSTYCDSSNFEKSTKDMITVNVIPNNVLGIADNNFAERISVYPNPANDKLNIDVEEKATIEIINLQGQIVDTKSLTEKVNNLDLSNLVSGVYTLRIKTDRGIAIRKLIKQ